MEEERISYQILEATDKLSGKIQKNENFSDFPIDLGAEWIHEDKSILNYLIDQPGNEPNAETILYQPINVQQAVNHPFRQIPNEEMIDYYSGYIKEINLRTRHGMILLMRILLKVSSKISSIMLASQL